MRQQRRDHRALVRRGVAAGLGLFGILVPVAQLDNAFDAWMRDHFGVSTGLLLTGAVLTETVFAWPGVGRMMLDAIRFRDYAILQGGILFFAVVIVFVNLLVDMSYGLLNPRIRYR